MSKFDGKFGKISFESLPEEAQCEIVERWIDEGEINLLCKLDENHYGVLDITPVVKEAFCPGAMFLFLDTTAEELENQLKVIRVQRCDEEQLIDAKEEARRIKKLFDCDPGDVGITKNIYFGDVSVPYIALHDWYSNGNPSFFWETKSFAEPLVRGNFLIAAGIDPATGKSNGLRPFDINEFFAQDCIVLYGQKADNTPKNKLAFLSKLPLDVAEERSEK